MIDESFPISSDEDIKDFNEKFEADPNNSIIHFQYALLLSKSDKLECKEESLEHLEQLLNNADDEIVNDCMYHIALTLYHLQRYDTARIYCEEIYRKIPDNQQVANLHSAIVSKHNAVLKAQEIQRTQAAVGLVGAGLLAAGIGLFFALRKK